jgi:prevent-host-death family protein
MARKGTQTISYVKTHTAALVEQVNQSRQPVIITQNGEPRAVVQDIASFERTREALMLLKLAAQGEAEIQAERAVDQPTALTEIRKRMRRA